MASPVLHLQLPRARSASLATSPPCAGVVGTRAECCGSAVGKNRWVWNASKRGLSSRRIASGDAAVSRVRCGVVRRRRSARGVLAVMSAEAAEGSGEESGRVAVAESGLEEVEEKVEEVEEEEKVEEEVEEEETEEQAEDRKNIEDVLMVVELLRTKRDMTFNEVRLTIMIEDPRDVERRRLLNIEDDRGCSREELGEALVDVYEGRVPQDRLILSELAKEMLNWPNLQDEINAEERTSPMASPYAKVTDTGVDPKIAAERARVEWDTAAEIQGGEEKKDISEMLPPVVGFSFLYLVSGIPIIIGITVVLILFFNSLQ